MAYGKQSKEEILEWRAKEHRELFAKSVNSQLMNSPKKALKSILNTAKTIVDKAFEYWPSPTLENVNEQEQEDFEFPVAEKKKEIKVKAVKKNDTKG